MNKTALHLLPLQDFVTLLKKNNICRFYLVFDEHQNKVTASHALLDGLAEFISKDKRDFKQHEGMFFHITPEYDTLQGVFIHKTVRGQGAGGVRYWQYNTVEDFLRDGMRLSKGMTRKNALAGLWWGGGKGVIAQNPEIEKRDQIAREVIFRAYGELCTSINGVYVTAEDVGTNVSDMANIFSQTRFTTCIPPELGGSGNPSVPTARGVLSAMEAAIEFTTTDKLAGKTVAVQGMGNVGGPLIKFLLEKGVAGIIANDIDEQTVRSLQKEFPAQKLQASVTTKGDMSILTAECDILAPCATGAILNSATIPAIKAKIVCGAANNQLEDSERDARALHERGVLYVPDFLANRMGIVNCSNEQYGYVLDDPFFEKHLTKEWEHSVYQTTMRVLRQSKDTGDTPAAVATRLADQLSDVPHPIFGHRGKQIIDSLIKQNWHEAG